MRLTRALPPVRRLPRRKTGRSARAKDDDVSPLGLPEPVMKIVDHEDLAVSQGGLHGTAFHHVEGEDVFAHQQGNDDGQDKGADPTPRVLFHAYSSRQSTLPGMGKRISSARLQHGGHGDRPVLPAVPASPGGRLSPMRKTIPSSTATAPSHRARQCRYTLHAGVLR